MNINTIISDHFIILPKHAQILHYQHLQIFNPYKCKMGNIQHNIRIIISDLQDLLAQACQLLQFAPWSVNPEWQV